MRVKGKAWLTLFLRFISLALLSKSSEDCCVMHQTPFYWTPNAKRVFVSNQSSTLLYSQSLLLTHLFVSRNVQQIFEIVLLWFTYIIYLIRTFLIQFTCCSKTWLCNCRHKIHDTPSTPKDVTSFMVLWYNSFWIVT